MAKTVKENESVAVIDLGDQIAAIVFKGGTISPAAASYAAAALHELEASRAGVVIAGDGEDFCSGIDLADITAAVSDKEWNKLKSIAEVFQSFTQAVKYSKIPVVTLAKGTVMDFGLETAQASAAVILAADAAVAYNTGKNGFAPMGGGLTQAALDTYAIGAGVAGADIVPFLKRTFNNLYHGRPAMGAEAAAKGYLPGGYIKVLRKEACTLDKAKQTALTLADEEYQAPLPATVKVKGFTGKGALDVIALNTALGFFITEAQMKIGYQVSRVITGGDVPDKTEVPEARLLELETEAFVKTLQEA